MARQAGAPHFGPELFRFLRQLERNNSRDWFQKHRDRYLEHVRDPILRFIADAGPKLAKISPQIVADPRPVGGSMFRIHRDTRFSRDKRPYKTHAGMQFRHRRGKDVHCPGFYLHLAPGSVFAGAGIWHPDAPALAAIRGSIAERPAAWKKVKRAPGIVLGGDSLVRPPRGFPSDHPLIEDLRRKDFYTSREMDEADALRPEFLDRFVANCRSASPLMRFLTGALDLEW